jgi:hypothetical protein
MAGMPKRYLIPSFSRGHLWERCDINPLRDYEVPAREDLNKMGFLVVKFTK